MSIGVFYKEIFNIPHLATFLNEDVVLSRAGKFPQAITAVAGWGQRPTSKIARNYAQQHKLPYLALEDGFLRSVGLGNQDAPLSLIVDDIGIYYDAHHASRLESLIPTELTKEQIHRAQNLIAAWQTGQVSKYNHLPEYQGELPEHYVLVVDQTFGDASIEYGLADAHRFQHMLKTALHENPDCTMLVKIHPDVFSGRKRGHFDIKTLSTLERVRVLSEDVHPVRLLKHAQAVYTVTSQMGFEALLWGKPVRTFGMPFYAGWGLTQDELPVPERRQILIQTSIALPQLVYAALIAYPRYVHPETGVRCEVEEILQYLAFQRQMRQRFPKPVYALNFPYWKKPIVRSFLQGSQVHFVRHLNQVPDAATLAVWGNNETVDLSSYSLLRLEDGFLRSVGLGADLIRPLSWVIDSRGLYYNAKQPSDLEHLLQTTRFSKELLQRAKNLREKIVQHGLTKYNVDNAQQKRFTITPTHPGQKIILVPGQVENDASLEFGAPNIRLNIKLLQAVRHEHPDAYIIYKPHPDVIAGLRPNGVNEDCIQNYCDEVVVNIAMGEILPQVDEVHVLTSLAGFEALLRNKQVTCYGQPFYAGWGLTTDKTPISRRTRQLSLDELVAATLILYPTYVSRITHHYTTAEQALEELLAWRSDPKKSQLPRWRRAIRPLLRLTSKK